MNDWLYVAGGSAGTKRTGRNCTHESVAYPTGRVVAEVVVEVVAEIVLNVCSWYLPWTPLAELSVAAAVSALRRLCTVKYSERTNTFPSTRLSSTLSRNDSNE